MTTPLPPCTCDDTLRHDCLRHGWPGVRDEPRGLKRRKRLRAETVEHAADSTRWAILKEAFIYLLGEKCQECGTDPDPYNSIDAHHVVARSRGGRSEPDNLRLLCRRCHEGETGVPMWSSNG